MKKITFYLLMFVVILATSCNQTSKNSSQTGSPTDSQPNAGPGNFNPEDMVDRQMEELTKALELNEEQEKQVREIFVANFESMKEMREKAGGDREAMREKMQSAREEQNTKIQALLTAEQWEKYQTIEKERRSKRGQGRPERPE
jgi:Spy/CpxP family protein refolding chaperone